MLEDIELSLGFEDVAISQKKNICNSRLDVNVESEVIKGVFRPIPLIAANMSTVINADFYLKLWELGALGIMHRAMSDMDMMSVAHYLSNKCPVVAMSIGVGEHQAFLAKNLIDIGTNVLVIDVAHGYSDSVINLAKDIKNYKPSVKIVLGNTTNLDMLYEVKDYCDALKVGIAQGFACETKNTAGCTERQFSAVLKFKKASKELGIPIISDGSVKEPADVVKAIGAGANSVMGGQIFARCPESAAELITENGAFYKLYAGMASRYVQNGWRGGLKDGTCPEGGVRHLPLGESLPALIERYSGALKSGITYAGGKDIKTFQENVKFVRFK